MSSVPINLDLAGPAARGQGQNGVVLSKMEVAQVTTGQHLARAASDRYWWLLPGTALIIMFINGLN